MKNKVKELGRICSTLKGEDLKDAINEWKKNKDIAYQKYMKEYYKRKGVKEK